MFVLTTVVESVRVPPTSFSTPNYPLGAIHDEIDEKYPNRVILDVGLVICRYGDVLEIGEGVCVAGDGGAHYECVFRLLVFRPFVDEVCVGTVILSTEEGLRVSLGGFFDDVFVPAYWMLRPSRYDASTGLWVWTPKYDDGDDGDDGEEGGGDRDSDGDGGGDGDGDGDGAAVRVKTEERSAADGEAEDAGADEPGRGGGGDDDEDGDDEEGVADGGHAEDEEGGEEGDRFEMELGTEIRFKVKALHFTRVTNTAKGVQATTTTTSTASQQQQAGAGRQRSLSGGSGGGGNADGGGDEMNKPVRQRSSSVDLSGAAGVPASFYIVASICEDGLGLTSWWDSSPEQDEEEQQGEEGDDQHDGGEGGDPYADEDYC